MDIPLHYLTYLFAALAVAVLLLWIAQHRMRSRADALERLLDSTDALELVLQSTRQRMQAMRAVVDRVPSDIAAVAHASLDTDAQVQQALRNVLEHRLWISREAPTASLAALRAALAAVDRSRTQIESRLAALESAGAELAQATQAAVEQGAREPPALRRTGSDDA